MQEEGILLIKETLEAVERVRVSVDELRQDFNDIKIAYSERFLKTENRLNNLKKYALFTSTIFGGVASVVVFLVKINYIRLGF